MKGGAALLAAALIFAGMAACGNEKEEGPVVAEFQKITAEEAFLKMEGEHVLLDVRTEEEFKERRIAGAVLIPVDELAGRAEAELPDKDALILVYCRSGRRSAAAAATLAGMGYAGVCDFGGILDWPYETVGG